MLNSKMKHQSCFSVSYHLQSSPLFPPMGLRIRIAVCTFLQLGSCLRVCQAVAMVMNSTALVHPHSHFQWLVTAFHTCPAGKTFNILIIKMQCFFHSLGEIVYTLLNPLYFFLSFPTLEQMFLQHFASQFWLIKFCLFLYPA